MFENVDQSELEQMGFIGAIACTANGEVIESTSDELEVFGGIMGYLTQVADLIGEPFGMDSIEEIHLETINTKAICMPQENGSIGLLCNSRANTDVIISELID